MCNIPFRFKPASYPFFCLLQLFSQESLDFQERIAERSGLGNDCPPSLPPALHILPQPIITMQVQFPVLKP